MKLKIHSIRRDKNAILTSADVVRGTVSLAVNSSLTLSRIELSMKAKLRSVAMVEVGAEHVACPQFLTLFKSSQVIFPDAGLSSSTRYTLLQGHHEHRFLIDLSLLSRYAAAETATATNQKRGFWNKEVTFYTFCVTIKGCGVLRRTVRKHMYLSSLAVDPPTLQVPLPSFILLQQSTRALPLEAIYWPKELTGEDGGFLPSYKPSITLNAGFSEQCDLLYAGSYIPLLIRLIVPSAVQEKHNIYLKSVRVSLMDPTVAVEGRHHVIDLKGMVIHEVYPDILLQSRWKYETFEIKLSLWRDIGIPFISFKPRSCNEMSRPYLLQILCGISCEVVPDIALASLLMPVDIATDNAPPKYSLNQRS